MCIRDSDILHHICFGTKPLHRHTQYGSNENVEQQWCEHATLPHALLHAEPVRIFAVIRPDARSHNIGEVTNNREHLRWYIESSMVHKRVRLTESYALVRTAKRM